MLDSVALLQLILGSTFYPGTLTHVVLIVVAPEFSG